VGQYLAEAAEALAARGWAVEVMTANRGYDDPRVKYPPREERGGVRVRRLPFASLGKRTLLHRLAGQACFCAQATLRALFGRRPERILMSTSPPMAGAIAWVANRLRGVPFAYWVMDINPDQAVAMGKVGGDSLPAGALEGLNRAVLRRAGAVVVLDRFMAETMGRKLPAARERIHVLPPWPLEGHLEEVAHGENPFRREHGLEGKFVVMYSGNHSLAHPLDTILEAALELQDDERLRFLFVGGGAGKRRVEAFIAEHGPRNVLSLPYQPLEAIKYSLSAADVHLVSLGEGMVGLVHPCKVYGALALGKPVLLLGPQPSHVADILERERCGWQIAHGNVAAARKLLPELAGMDPAALEAMGARGRAAMERDFRRERLRARFCELAVEVTS